MLDRIPGAIPLARLLRRWIDPDLRMVHALRRSQRDHLFQPFTTTSENRYPQLFTALAERLAHLPQPRILSFGCSSGEEVRALRRYLPHALITGIDINPRVLELARQADNHPLSRYVLADRPDPSERYDAVLAMAVFRHGDLEAERPESCAAILPFARFAEGIARLDAVLEPGGWLALWNAHFRFIDTPVADGYLIDPFRMSQRADHGPLYGPDDSKIAEPGQGDALFRKREATAALAGDKTEQQA